MTISGKIAIAGVHEYESRYAPDKTELQIMAECAREALADAGLTLADVDGLLGASMTMGAMGMVQLSEYLNIKPRFFDGNNIGGSSFVGHVAHAGAAIAAGLCEVALILYGSKAASDAMAIGTGDASGRDPGAAFVAPYGMTLVSSYAMVAARHMHQYGTKPEQLADSLAALRFALSPEQLTRLNEASSVELGFPHDFIRNESIRNVVYGDQHPKLDWDATRLGAHRRA